MKRPKRTKPAWARTALTAAILGVMPMVWIATGGGPARAARALVPRVAVPTGTALATTPGTVQAATGTPRAPAMAAHLGMTAPAHVSARPTHAAAHPAPPAPVAARDDPRQARAAAQTAVPPLASATAALGPFMRGMTYAGYNATVFASAASDAQVRAMARAGVNTISVQTAWYQATPTSTRIVPTAQTPSDASLVHLIDLIHSLHMRVFLDPFVNATTGEAWQGAFHPTSWPAWFRAYDAMIAHYAHLAQQTHVQLLSLGDENDTSDHNPALLSDYLQLVRLARRIYKGPITYGGDYPDYQQIPAAFWRSLNAIGIEAYFPLAASTDPSPAELDSAWKREVVSITAWRQREGLTDEPVIITELGYYSANTTAENPGSWEPAAPLDLALQVACYRAAFTTIYQQPWLDGIFWFWWANPSDGPDWPAVPTNNGYNVQAKPVLALIEAYYRAVSGSRQPEAGVPAASGRGFAPSHPGPA